MDSSAGATDPASRHPGPRIDQAAGLLALAQLPLDVLELDQLLSEVGRIATGVLPSAASVAVRAREAGRAEVFVASSDLAAQLEEIQRAVAQGPSVQALDELAVQYSPSLGGEPRWPRFGPRAGRLGAHSALALPLIRDQRTVGAITLYSQVKDAFAQHEQAFCRTFAQTAATVVANAQLLAASRRTALNLESNLRHQATVERAIGILMGRRRCAPEEALDILRELSQRHNQKLVQVAGQVIADGLSQPGEDVAEG